MGLFSWIYPDEYLDSAYDIDYEKFYEDGFRGVIFDIDNTLVPQDAPSDERSDALLRRLKDIGYQVMLLSNNKEPRVKMFLETMKERCEEEQDRDDIDSGDGVESDNAGESTESGIKIEYIHKAGKPSRKGYRKAMEQMGTNTGNTLFVGDQLFTDVWGARRTGIYSILVKPMDPHEEIQIVIKRKIEKPFLAGYLKQRKGKK